MPEVFAAKQFVFPYIDIKFPGQASDERILYVTREAPVMLYLRLIFITVPGLVIVVGGWKVINFLGNYFNLSFLIWLSILAAGLMFWVIGSWWVYTLWHKSIFILTTRRLTKFIYSTPWNRYNLSLTLDQVVDTGSYARGYFQALTKIGTFTARSGAGNRPEKYFYIENVQVYEDLANYVNKILFVFHQNPHQLNNFRPFIPHLKGEARKEFMKQYPQYWS